MTKILQFILTKYPLQEYPTLYVLTVPSSTIDQIGARSFIKHVAKKVLNIFYWFKVLFLQPSKKP